MGSKDCKVVGSKVVGSMVVERSTLEDSILVCSMVLVGSMVGSKDHICPSSSSLSAQMLQQLKPKLSLILFS